MIEIYHKLIVHLFGLYIIFFSLYSTIFYKFYAKSIHMNGRHHPWSISLDTMFRNSRIWNSLSATDYQGMALYYYVAIIIPYSALLYK